jgi:hypothetical protein
LGKPQEKTAILNCYGLEDALKYKKGNAAFSAIRDKQKRSKTMKKTLLIICIVTLCAGMFSACSNANDKEDAEIKVMLVDGAPLLSICRMILQV